MRNAGVVTACALVMGLLVGCDQLGIDTPEKVAQRKGAEARAIGAACRHAVRAIEDCYVLNPKADKAAVFEGWREMDEYMRENKIDGVLPVVPRAVPQLKGAPAASQAEQPAEDVRGEASASKSRAE